MDNFDFMALDIKEHTDRGEIYDYVYRVPPDELIAMATRRSGPGGIQAPRYHSIIKRRDMQEWFPQLLKWKLEDPEGNTEYQSFATLGEGALKKDYQFYLEGILKQKIIYFRAGKSHAKSMTALVIDLDVGRKSIREAEWALMVIRVKARERELPWPGFVVSSGRGLYVMWLLGDEDTGLAPVTSRENQALYEKCYMALSRRIEELCVDFSKKSDYSAWFKAPGTIDTKTGNQVMYMTIGIDSVSNIPIYSLQDLLNFFDCPHAPEAELAQGEGEQPDLQLALPDPDNGDPQRKKRITKPGKGSEPYLARVRDIEKIVWSRKDHKDYRHFIIWNYYQDLLTFHKINKHPNPTVLSRQEAEKLNNLFKPSPLLASEFEHALKHTPGKRRRSSTIALQLAVTEKEVADLNLKAIAPPSMKEAIKYEQERVKKEREQQFLTRQLTIDAAILNGKSNAQIMAAYKSEYGPALTRSYLHQRRKKLAVDTSGQPIAYLKNSTHEQLELPF